MTALVTEEIEGVSFPAGVRFRQILVLLPPERLFAVRTERAKAGLHPVDRDITPELVADQVGVYETLALHFHRCGLGVYLGREFAGPRWIVEVYLRREFAGPPRWIVDSA